MIHGNQGVYPDWMLEQNVIDRILGDLKERGGRLPYQFLINPNYRDSTKNRIKNILSKMSREHLIHAGNDFIELDEEGNQALQTGYERYCKAKRAALFRRKVKTTARVLTYLFIATIIGLTIYRIIEVY
ncbi:MAG TPA: hypothetical protein VK808_08350 [Bacteroidia bacterium]|jgi:hypothetical protein|nr:hypothetical protein [Bacteroidia bacterium]